MSLLQRVVMPSPDNSEALPLYVQSPWTKVSPWGDGQTEPAAGDGRPITLGADHLLTLEPGIEAGFGTYVNAFPASYWRAYTVVEHVTLELDLEGSGTISVYRSDHEGQRFGISYVPVPTGGRVEIEIPLGQCQDGGWIWFELQAGAERLTLRSGAWTTPSEPLRTGLTSIGITTHNKPTWCMSSLRRLADSADLLELVTQVVVVDQGTDLLTDAAGFDEVASGLGERLRVVRQGNLGGSGGFTRGMIEAVHREGTENALLLDDDVRLDPEGIRRAITFSRFARTPVIVGGQMFDLNRPAVLHAFAEWVDPQTFVWAPAPQSHRKHDFSRRSLLETPWLHKRIEGDFNGWWMCLIPVSTLKEIGYSLPLFLKWDDTEYGLRAAEHGVPTVSLPGAWIWHVTWLDKDDTLDWQSYFHARNRLVVALLHGRQGLGSPLSALEFRWLVRRTLAMQYGTTAIRLRALREILHGPHTLHEGIGTVIADIRAEAATYADMVRHDPADLPSPSIEGTTLGAATTMEGEPRGLGFIAFAARTLVRSLLTPARAAKGTSPQASFAHRYGEWWRTPHFDSVLVPTADNQAYFWLRRSRKLMIRQLVEAARLSLELRRRWPELQAEYRAAEGGLTSETTWRRTIGL
ncbi:galactofuranosylgalactofuranosylrhamnosyl-N-acetylglucosaminyl-diphospho-decaprenol beta-1,5/1,6-galactofuranosyltransferase [Salana multivorans]|uniref:Galactofuranosylgalactofuranosylrhamnosyl-N-acetylglucosaminyl-diphospho-decaprenol beta-1,5/1,6-galactofuranosyltransferase n=1 Tax=Salana multivorans TaxID=120377 RepID=A0A3N2D7J3_9MICO|nr:glycosyltransferase [Salana multivorans]ROR95751.1 galactofuranosylgalactofuranosylrhamnosyl-N-acetylglucosaminyl-diphospho-decaprenol beta-1,5/1,6-galactofuranosyltransferase [Salana multivorans]